jgi:polar amino acid transport system substrate-binding protein
MKKTFALLSVFISLFLFGCKKEEDKNILRFAVSADYPPFEYIKNDQLVGFDIDLAHLIAQKMGKKAEFENVPFNAVMPSLQMQKADMGISTIAVNEERAKEFDFSKPYYFEKVAVIYKKDSPITSIDALHGKRISCLLGSVQEMWVKENLKNVTLTPLKHTNQAVESLKAGHVDAMVVDGVQAVEFVRNNDSLSSAPIAESKDGFAVAFKKGNKLRDEVDFIIEDLQKSGELEKLKKKWVG